MVDFVISNIDISNDTYRISWDASAEVDFLSRQDIVVTYNFALKKNFFLPLNITLAAFLPILVKKFKRVRVILPFHVNDITRGYWSAYIKEVLHTGNFELSLEGGREGMQHDEAIFASPPSGIGLFFGGGVESMFALSTMHHKKPVLISVRGRGWMNNDSETGRLKFSIEEELCEKYGLQIERVDMNIRPLLQMGDEEMNQYVTGGLFYFLSLPIADRFGIGTIYHSMEYEYASTFSDWDLSLSPYFTKNLFIRERSFPLVFSIYNAFPKVKMLEELSKTDFIRYIYSCFRNTDKRWCGECSKCFRISEFCERIVLDRSLIGMQEGIIGKRETSPLARLYWRSMDRFYGRRYTREIKLAFLYYMRKIKACFFRDTMRSTVQDIPFLDETGTIQFSIDLISRSRKYLKVQGWGYRRGKMPWIAAYILL